jgi:hypothetical protein
MPPPRARGPNAGVGGAGVVVVGGTGVVVAAAVVVAGSHLAMVEAAVRRGTVDGSLLPHNRN